ncbi:hypothetical protein J6590_059528 [Homalodisca vitripennis]|nr:hypothetical protein J6590_059528 [Homalodisca vitripennis]
MHKTTLVRNMRKFASLEDHRSSLLTDVYRRVGALSYALTGSVRPVRSPRYFFERALRTVLHPPSAKTEMDVEDEIAVVSTFLIEEENVKIRKRKNAENAVPTAYWIGQADPLSRNVQHLIAPDFLSDMPKVRNAVDGRNAQWAQALTPRLVRRHFVEDVNRLVQTGLKTTACFVRVSDCVTPLTLGLQHA